MQARKQIDSEVARVLADVLGEVPLFLFALNPILVSAHVEEAFVGVLASRVPPVHVEVLFRGLRLLDVPEDMVWQLGKDLVEGARREALVERPAQISRVVVLLALLERVELASQNLIPLLLVEPSLFNLVKQGHSGLVLVLCLDRIHILLQLELASELLLIELASDLFLLQLVENGTVLKRLGTSKWLKEGLLEGAELVAARPELADATLHALGSLLLVLLDGANIVVVLKILLFVERAVLGDLRCVVSDVDFLELALEDLLLGIGDELLHLLLHAVPLGQIARS